MAVYASPCHSASTSPQWVMASYCRPYTPTFLDCNSILLSQQLQQTAVIFVSLRGVTATPWWQILEIVHWLTGQQESLYRYFADCKHVLLTCGRAKKVPTACKQNAMHQQSVNLCRSSSQKTVSFLLCFMFHLTCMSNISLSGESVYAVSYAGGWARRQRS